MKDGKKLIYATKKIYVVLREVANAVSSSTMGWNKFLKNNVLYSLYTLSGGRQADLYFDWLSLDNLTNHYKELPGACQRADKMAGL